MLFRVFAVLCMLQECCLRLNEKKKSQESLVHEVYATHEMNQECIILRLLCHDRFLNSRAPAGDSRVYCEKPLFCNLALIT
jgi:hypothetical protein